MDVSRFLPTSGNGNIIITTRNPTAQIHSTLGSFHFTGMDPEEAITLLLRLAYPEREAQHRIPGYRQTARVIAAELGYLPLALKQAAMTIRRGIWPLERYIKSLIGCRKALLSHPSILSSTTANITATWELPFMEITKGTTQLYRDAVDLIHIFAFMHFGSIPVKVFSWSWDGMRQTRSAKTQRYAFYASQSAQEVEERVLTAAKLLYDHSIISITETIASPGRSRDNGTTHFFSLHPAIHHWARERLDIQEQRQLANTVASIIAHSISTNMETSGRSFRRLLLPHIRACLSSLGQASHEMPSNSEQAFELERFSYVYAENGLWEKSRSLQAAVADFRARHLGPYHSDTIRARRQLANSFWNLWETEKCLKTQLSILKALWWSRPSFLDWLIRPWRPIHLPYCIALDDLTRSLWLIGKRDKSLYTGKRAVEGLMQQLGGDDPLTLNAMFNLARTYLHLGQHEESLRLLLLVLKKRLHFFGPEHPDSLMTRNELGMSLFAQRVRLDEAEHHVRQVLLSRMKVLGEEHAYTLWSVNDLSKICCELERFDEAIAMLEEIVPVVRRTLGETHVGMIMTQTNLSRAYILCHRWAEADEILSKIRLIVPRVHPDWIHVNWGYAKVLASTGRLDEAETLCNEMLSEVAVTKVLDESSPRLLAIAKILLSIYERQDRVYDITTLRARFPRVENDDVLASIDHMPLRHSVPQN